MEDDRMSNSREEEQRFRDAYLKLRKAIGLLGATLPWVLLAGLPLVHASGIVVDCECVTMPDSISAYYHTCMRNVFVGGLCATGVFFLAYQGHRRKSGELLSDGALASFTGLFALSVALAPVEKTVGAGGIWHTIHLVSASLFFASLILFAMYIFRRGEYDIGDPLARGQTRVYWACGVAMAVAIGLIGVYFLMLRGVPWIDRLRPVFWLETFALGAFALSWFLKGQWFEGLFRRVGKPGANRVDRWVHDGLRWARGVENRMARVRSP